MLSELWKSVDTGDEQTYRALISASGADAAELAEKLALDVEQTAASLGRLTAIGLVQRRPDDTFVPSPPDLIIGPVLARSRERLRLAEDLLAELSAAYRRENSHVSADRLVEAVEGEAVGRRLLELEFGAKATVYAFQSGRNRVAPVHASIPDGQEASNTLAEDDTLEGVRTRARRGVHYRIVVDKAFLEEPAAVRALHRRLEEGAEVRVVDEPLRKLAVVDGNLALVQTGEARAAMLYGPLAALALDLFETTWRTARPYLADAADLELVDRQLLQLMLAGLTDQALAGQLGSSPRTVQRRIRVLMDVTGSTSRMQLAWQAAKRGWV